MAKQCLTRTLWICNAGPDQGQALRLTLRRDTSRSCAPCLVVHSSTAYHLDEYLVRKGASMQEWWNSLQQSQRYLCVFGCFCMIPFYGIGIGLLFVALFLELGRQR